MRYLLLMSALIAFVVSPVVSAEFYRYKDKDGVIRFTDNLNEVPLDQRPKIYQGSVVDPNKAPSEMNLGSSERDKVENLEQEKLVIETRMQEIRHGMEQAESARSFAATREEAEQHDEAFRQAEMKYAAEWEQVYQIENRIIDIKKQK